MTTAASFETAFCALAKTIREELSAANISRMCFRVEADGATLSGDLAIKFSIGVYGDEVSGNSVDAVVEEFMRRRGWNNRHQPLCLPRVSETSDESEEVAGGVSF